MYDKKYYTLEEANEAISEIRPILKKVIELNYALSCVQNIEIRNSDYFSQLMINLKSNIHFHRLQLEYHEEVEKLMDRGIVLKDPVMGLVDFYSYYQGEEVFLCYRYGEDSVEYYHELNEGFMSRRELT